LPEGFVHVPEELKSWTLAEPPPLPHAVPASTKFPLASILTQSFVVKVPVVVTNFDVLPDAVPLVNGDGNCAPVMVPVQPPAQLIPPLNVCGCVHVLVSFRPPMSLSSVPKTLRTFDGRIR
jgi:hypothetical protein